MNEIMPPRIRSRAFGFFVSLNWLGNIVISLCTLSAIEALGSALGGAALDGADRKQRGVAALYALFALASAAAFAFVSCLVPETRGRVMGGDGTVGDQYVNMDYVEEDPAIFDEERDGPQGTPAVGTMHSGAFGGSRSSAPSAFEPDSGPPRF
jgi:hypothetical protein